MRTLLVCFILGCGGSSPAPQAPASSAGSAAPVAPAAAVAPGSGSAAGIEAMIAKFADLERQACDCPDATCLDKVQDAMGAWGQELKAKGLVNAGLTDDQMTRLAVLRDQTNKCAKRTSNMSGE